MALLANAPATATVGETTNSASDVARTARRFIVTVNRDTLALGFCPSQSSLGFMKQGEINETRQTSSLHRSLGSNPRGYFRCPRALRLGWALSYEFFNRYPRSFRFGIYRNLRSCLFYGNSRVNA